MHNTPPSLTIDLEYYQQYLEDSTLTDAQKQELLETLWQIICECVRMGYGIHPLQHIQQENDTKTLAHPDRKDTPALPDMLSCIDQALKRKETSEDA